MNQNNSNIIKIVDSVWCRTLCVLERLETVIDTCCKRTTLCHDIHPDRDKITQSLSEIEAEFQIQLMALERAKAPIRNQMKVFADDLKGWIAGRVKLEKSRVDELTYILLKCLSGIPCKSILNDDKDKDKDKGSPEIQGGNVQLVEDPLKHTHIRGDSSTGYNHFIKIFPDSKDLFYKIETSNMSIIKDQLSKVHR